MVDPIKFVFCEFQCAKNKQFKKFLCCRVPFDWRNPFGFAVMFIVQAVGFAHMVTLIACLNTLPLVFTVLAFGMTRVIKRNLHLINRSAKSAKRQSTIPNQFSNFIQYHATLKQLSRMEIHAFLITNCIFFIGIANRRSVNDFSLTIKPFILLLFLWGVLTICDTLLMLQMEIVKC